MKPLFVTLWAESLKTRKSKVFWLTIVFFIFVSFMMGLIVFLQQHPELSEKLGLMGAKANMLKLGDANWENYLTLINQGISAIGLIGYGFVTCWIFGREYSDQTIKDLLSLPVSRRMIVQSKFIVATIWSILLSIVYFGSALIFGYLAGLPGRNGETILEFASTFAGIVLLTLLLSPLVAFFASYSRGFLLPIGIIILTMIMANFVGLIGLGPYFPWAIPGLMSVSEGADGTVLNTASYIILSATGILGLIGTTAWWQNADQK